jgi:hypothetical protein
MRAQTEAQSEMSVSVSVSVWEWQARVENALKYLIYSICSVSCIAYILWMEVTLFALARKQRSLSVSLLYFLILWRCDSLFVWLPWNASGLGRWLIGWSLWLWVG